MRLTGDATFDAAIIGAVIGGLLTIAGGLVVAGVDW